MPLDGTVEHVLGLGAWFTRRAASPRLPASQDGLLASRSPALCHPASSSLHLPRDSCCPPASRGLGAGTVGVRGTEPSVSTERPFPPWAGSAAVPSVGDLERAGLSPTPSGDLECFDAEAAVPLGLTCPPGGSGQQAVGRVDAWPSFPALGPGTVPGSSSWREGDSGS